MGIRRGLFVTIFILIGISSGFAQRADETFGKNRVQYRQFDWQYLSGENFDLYFYDNRKDVAREALEYLESEFDRITDMIGYPPYFKTKVFMYNSLGDLRQSNVGLNRTIYTVGGETEFVKPYVEVAHLGTIQEFKEELLFQVSSLMVDEMMFGGNLKDIFQSALLLNLPDWFVDGASLYIAKGWSVEMDDFIRQFMRKSKPKKLGKLEGREAALAGQSVWNFIGEKYGKSSIANILNYTRVTRNEEKSILITLGISFKQLMTEWQQYYAEMEAVVSKSYVVPPDSNIFTLFHNKTTQFTTVKISPDGRYIAYAENDRGHYVVKVKELATEREKVIIRGGSKVINQRVDYNVPLISWADDHTLGVIGLTRGHYMFWLYDLSTKSTLPRQLDRFSNVRSFDFSSNGRLMILSADFEGQNDLFLGSTRRDRVRRLTNDIYDDLDPVFVPNSASIVFSSNRSSDTLKVGKTEPIDKLTNNYNLYSYDLDTTKTILRRITNTLSKDYAPKALDEHTFVYLSDQRGIINLFKFDLNTSIYSQVTNYASSIKEYDLNFSSRQLAVVATKDMRENIFISSNFNPDRQIFTPATRRKDLQQARAIRQRRKQAAPDTTQNKKMSIKDFLKERMKESQPTEDDTVAIDTIENKTPPIPEGTVGKDSVNTVVPQGDSTVVATDDREKSPVPNAEKEVNTDNYEFEDEVIETETKPSDTFLTRVMKSHEKSRITGPFPYEPKFSADNLVTSLVIDPLRGLGLSIETQMNDMLENYRFFGGLMTTIDLRNCDVYAEWQYLPNYIDYNVRFDRKAIRWEPSSSDDEDIYNYTLHRIEAGASLPLSDRARFTIKPMFELARSVSLGSSASPPEDTVRASPLNNYYGGIRSEIVYDNSVSTGMNIIEGTRAKIAFVHHQGLNNEDNSFSQVYADIRHYQKLYKDIVLAFRGYGGSFFGRSPKQYLLGGMDNWAFNEKQDEGTTSEGEPNPLGVYGQDNQDLLFVEFATNLRGFDYATLFGNNVLLFNAELRVPLRTFAGGPISSNFFRNMQFTGFYDIGTSWSGAPPFDSQNSVSYKVIDESPFEVQLKNFLNPWLYSYGVGLRSVILGYYVKFDLAWPVENFEVADDPRLQFTLGFDF